MHKTLVERTVSILDEFQPRFDTHVLGFLAVYPFSAAGWLFGIGGIADSSVVITIASVLVAAYFILLMSYLLLRAVRWQQADSGKKREISRIRAARDRFATRVADIQSKNPEYFTIDKYHEEAWILPEGRARIIRTASLIAGPVGIDVFFAGMFSSEFPADQKRSAVQISVVQITAEGEIPCVFERNWPQREKVRVYAFLPRHFSHGERLEFRIVFEWPRYWSRLNRNGRDTIEFRLGRQVRELEYVLHADKSLGLNNIVAQGISGGLKPRRINEADGSVRIEASRNSVNAGEELKLEIVL